MKETYINYFVKKVSIERQNNEVPDQYQPFVLKHHLREKEGKMRNNKKCDRSVRWGK